MELVHGMAECDNVHPTCPLCVAPTMRRVLGRIQVTPRPWYEKEEVGGWPTGMGDKEKTEHRKRWDAESDKSWEGRAPSKDDFQTTSAQDIFKGLTQDTVQRELVRMADDA